LQTAKDTRLIVRNKVLDEDAHRKRFLNFFTEAGIEADRIILLGSAEHHEFLQTYGKIDLALDTFPYNGGTTTTEAIWQGVPVVCFSGDRWISRTSATILHFGELNQFIGANVNEYIDLAVKWSAPEQRATLRNLRQKMREKLKNSKVCDGAGLAKNFEEIVFEIKNQNR
jgi:protein O-GlcNAc transferase